MDQRDFAEICLTANGAPVNIRLSRYCLQQNLARLSFEEAELWADVYSLERLLGQDAR